MEHLVHNRIIAPAMRTLTALFLLFGVSAFAAETPDLTMQTRIRQEEFRNSKVMEIATGLIDGIGARLTGSPNLQRANEWTRDKLTEFGMSNAHLEAWTPFGRGWSYEACSLRLGSPDVLQLLAIPRRRKAARGDRSRRRRLRKLSRAERGILSPG